MAPPSEPAEQLLRDLEQERQALSQRLETVERRLRELRTVEAVCLKCGGIGKRSVRGGLYGERQWCACECGTPSS
jgi:hypothetical protein